MVAWGLPALGNKPVLHGMFDVLTSQQPTQPLQQPTHSRSQSIWIAERRRTKFSQEVFFLEDQLTDVYHQSCSLFQTCDPETPLCRISEPTPLFCQLGYLAEECGLPQWEGPHGT